MEQKNKNYLLGLYLMTILLKDKLPEIGKSYNCVFTRTGECDAILIERVKCMTNASRNIPFYPGKYLNCTIRPNDLHVRLNFKELNFGPGFDIDAYAIEVMMEVRKALNEAMSLIEEKLNLGA